MNDIKVVPLLEGVEASVEWRAVPGELLLALPADELLVQKVGLQDRQLLAGLMVSVGKTLHRANNFADILSNSQQTQFSNC